MELPTYLFVNNIDLLRIHDRAGEPEHDAHVVHDLADAVHSPRGLSWVCVEVRREEFRREIKKGFSARRLGSCDARWVEEPGACSVLGDFGGWLCLWHRGRLPS